MDYSQEIRILTRFEDSQDSQEILQPPFANPPSRVINDRREIVTWPECRTF